MELAARMLIELLREGQTVRFVARGSSMWPAVRDGAVVEVTPCAAASLAPGELAAYEGAHGPVVHRVVAVEPGAVRLRGDARPVEDRVEPARVLGRARVVSSPPWRLRVPGRAHVALALRAARSWLRRARGRT